MFRIILVALALYVHFGPVLERPPDLHGLATWYGPPIFDMGRTMANGEPLDLFAPTVAVDVSHRDEWLNKKAVILTECGGVHRVRITDTGYLYRAGLFRLGIQAGIQRYWSVGELSTNSDRCCCDPWAEMPETRWMQNEAYPVVADFPQAYFARQVACQVDGWGKGDTTRIWVWVLDD